MTDDLLLTVCLPVFNDAGTLDVCLDSIRRQGFHEWQVEVLAFDDGSTDDSIEKLELWRDCLPLRIVALARSGGPAIARNLAIGQARGTYTLFLDADDYLEPGVLPHLLGTAEKTEADVVLAKPQGHGRQVDLTLFAAGTKAIAKEDPGVFRQLNVHHVFKTAFLRGLPYRFDPQLNAGEDHPFMAAVYLTTPRVWVWADSVVYHLVRVDEAAQRPRRHMTDGGTYLLDQPFAFVDATLAVIDEYSASAPVRELAATRYWDRVLQVDAPRAFALADGRHRALARELCAIARRRGTGDPLQFPVESRPDLEALIQGPASLERAVCLRMRPRPAIPWGQS